MKVKWLLVFAIAPISVGALTGFLDKKSVIMGAIVPQVKLCPDYETNPELEALTNCIEHPRRDDKPVYNHPAYCEKFKPHGSDGLDDSQRLSVQDSALFKKMRCPLG